jgi:hypothetical protein
MLMSLAWRPTKNKSSSTEFSTLKCSEIPSDLKGPRSLESRTIGISIRMWGQSYIGAGFGRRAKHHTYPSALSSL